MAKSEEKTIIQWSDTDKKEFTCPECGAHEILAVEQCTTYYSIDGVKINVPEDKQDDELELHIDDMKSGFSGDDEEILYYRCAKCGLQITKDNGMPILTVRELWHWLMDHKVVLPL